MGMWCYSAGAYAWQDVVTSKVSSGQRWCEDCMDAHLVLSRDYLALRQCLNLIIY
jgi:hypothetical protein